MSKATIGAFIAYALVIFAARSQNLLLNGSFESPIIPTNSFGYETPTYWSWSGGSRGYIFNGNVPIGSGGSPAEWPLPQDGQQFVDIGNQPIFALSQNFTVTNQGGYILSWYDNTGQFAGTTGSQYSVTIITATTQTVTNKSFDAYNPISAWLVRSIQLQLSPATYRLQFQAAGVGNGLDTLIDNVTLVPAGPLVSLVQAVTPSFANLIVGTNYQLLIATDLSGTFTNYGSPFTATNTSMVYPQYWNVDNWYSLFFRLQVSP